MDFALFNPTFDFLAPTFRKLYLKSKKRYALKILNSINQKDVAALCKISEILRRTCLIKHKDAVTLSGADWAIFLNKHSHTKIEKSLLSLLVDAPYMPESKQITADDFDKIKNFALSFVEDNL